MREKHVFANTRYTKNTVIITVRLPHAMAAQLEGYPNRSAVIVGAVATALKAKQLDQSDPAASLAAQFGP
jgi:hypothetical protein